MFQTLHNYSVPHAVFMCGYDDVGRQRRELSAVTWFREGILEDVISELSVQHGCHETGGFNWCQSNPDKGHVPGTAFTVGSRIRAEVPAVRGTVWFRE